MMILFICQYLFENYRSTTRHQDQIQKKLRKHICHQSIIAFSFGCFCSVLSHVPLQQIGQFAGVVTLLAGKGFLAGV